jgi:hypothetical protein
MPYGFGIEGLKMFNKIQEGIGNIAIMVVVMLSFLVVSWVITCAGLYIVSLLWEGTPFAFEWSLSFSTGIWIILSLVGSFLNTDIKLKEEE